MRKEYTHKFEQLTRRLKPGDFDVKEVPEDTDINMKESGPSFEEQLQNWPFLKEVHSSMNNISVILTELSQGTPWTQVVNPETAEETVIKFEQCLEVIEEYVGLPKESDIPHIPMGCNDKEDQSAMDEDGQHHNSTEATPQSAGELCSSPPSHPAQQQPGA